MKKEKICEQFITDESLVRQHTASSSKIGHSNLESYSLTNPLSLAIFETSCHFNGRCLAISAQIRDLPTPGVPV